MPNGFKLEPIQPYGKTPGGLKIWRGGQCKCGAKVHKVGSGFEMFTPDIGANVGVICTACKEKKEAPPEIDERVFLTSADMLDAARKEIVRLRQQVTFLEFHVGILKTMNENLMSSFEEIREVYKMALAVAEMRKGKS